MANGFSGFYIGSSGLRMSQNALNTTANNLANVDTTGYVREQVRFADTTYDTLVQPTTKTNVQQSGLGVSIGDVAHARDIFLDKAYRQENGRDSFYATMYDVTSYVEDLFQELDGEEFKESVSDLWTAIQEFAKDPSDSTNQNLVLQKGELLLSRSQALYTDLQNYQDNINEQIKDDIERVNEIGDRIYEINLEVQKIEASGLETAMTLRDERDNLIDELSQYFKIEVTEDNTGFDYVSIEGTLFVNDSGCYNIGLDTAKGTGFYTPYWPQLTDKNSKDDPYPVINTSLDISTESNTDIGEVKALLIARGDTYGRYYDMDEGNYDDIEDCIVMETEAEVDYLLRNIVKGINDVFCPNATGAEALNLEEGDTITAYDADGNEYTIASDTLVLDVDNCSYGTDYELPPQEIFTRIGQERYTTVTDDSGNTYYIYNEEDPDDNSTWYALGAVSINDVLSKTVTKMPAYTENGTVNYSLGDQLTEVWEATNMQLSPDDTQPVNFENYYNKILGRLGTVGNVYKTANETLEATVASVDNQRQQVTGVNSDEELTNMVKFQSAYNAASRFINVVNEMTELIVQLI